MHDLTVTSTDFTVTSTDTTVTSAGFFVAHTDLIELVLARDAGHLHVAFDLLADLLVAIHDGHTGNGMDPEKQRLPGLTLLSKYHWRWGRSLKTFWSLQT